MNLTKRLQLLLWGWCSRLLLLPVFVRYWWLGRREPAYRRRWAQRLGFADGKYAADKQVDLWVHAVSLGEVRAVTPLLERLLQRGHRLLVSCMTPAGSEQVMRVFGGRVRHCYAPLDTPGCLKRFFGRVRPPALMLVEAELWPGLLHLCHQRGIPVLLANARMSSRSAAGYRRFASLFASLFADIECALARTEADQERLIGLGFAADRVVLAGDLKYSLENAEQAAQQAQQMATQMALQPAKGKRRPVLVAGSTHDGEEQQLLASVGLLWRQYPDLLLVLAPRQPRRFAAVAERLQRAGLQISRRSADEKLQPTTQVLLLDSIGELQACYFFADIAFVGGSMVPAGGHNLLEAAAASKPILAGKYLDNFADAAERLSTVGALHRVADADELAAVASAWLADAAQAKRRGEAGRALVAADQGSLQCHLLAVDALLHRAAD